MEYTKETEMSEIKNVLLMCLDDAFDAEPWHGPNLMGTIQPLSLEQAVFNKTIEGYSPWQIVLHCAYWKWAVRKGLSGGEIEPFAGSPADWPALPGKRDQPNWEKAMELLRREHEKLLEAVGRLSDEKLLEPKDGRPLHWPKYINSIAAHDVYHAAQIRNMGVPGIK
jgi:hypothetical protein